LLRSENDEEEEEDFNRRTPKMIASDGEDDCDEYRPL
jgi:hypothetical protein